MGRREFREIVKGALALFERVSGDLQFELIIPGGVRIALIAAPSDTEVENRNEGTLDVPTISTAPTSS
jgi:hypothetical protein